MRTASIWSLFGAKPGKKPTNRQSDCCSLAFALAAGAAAGGLGFPCAEAVRAAVAAVCLGGGGVTCVACRVAEKMSTHDPVCLNFMYPSIHNSEYQRNL